MIKLFDGCAKARYHFPFPVSMNKKQLIFTLAKIAFAAIVITLLLYKVDAAKVWGYVRSAAIAPILAGIALCWCTVLIAGLRWHRLLRAFEIGIPLFALVCIAQIGQFFLVFLPGPAGDDLTRMLYISRLSKGRAGEACASVLLDRCIGLASILLLAVACISFQWPSLAVSPKTYWPAVCIFAAGLVVLAGVLLYFVIDGLFMQRAVEKLLNRFQTFKMRGELALISKRIFTSKLAVAEVLAAAICTQFLLCSVYYFAGKSVGIPASIAIWLGFVPIVLAANAIPITVFGLGVREPILVLYLGVLGHVDNGKALASSFIVLSITLAVCLLGGIVYIFYRPPGANSPQPA